MNCKTHKISLYIFSIFSQITIIFTFLIIFYFNYVKFIERTTFLSQIDDILDELLYKIPKPKQSNSIQSFFDTLIKKIKSKNSNANKSINEENEKLSIISMNMVFGLIGVFLLYTVIVTLTGNCLPLKSVFIESIIGLVFIALTEYLFLQIIVANYKSADPNYVRWNIANTIQNYAKKKL